MLKIPGINFEKNAQKPSIKKLKNQGFSDAKKHFFV